MNKCRYGSTCIIYIVIHQMLLVSWLYRHKDGYCERDPRADLGNSSNCREINEYFEICCRSPLREIDRLSKRRYHCQEFYFFSTEIMIVKYHGLMDCISYHLTLMCCNRFLEFLDGPFDRCAAHHVLWNIKNVINDDRYIYIE